MRKEQGTAGMTEHAALSGIAIQEAGIPEDEMTTELIVVVVDEEDGLRHE